MIGDKVGETKGRTTGTRSKGIVNGNAVIESDFADDGRIRGVDVHLVGSYVGTTRIDGTIYGEGSGILSSREGDVVSWRATAVGKIGAGGAAKWHGLFVFEPSGGKLASWSDKPLSFEYDVDPQGNEVGRAYEVQ